MKRLAILTTHPIQYYAPIFQLLQSRKKVEVMVFYSKPPEKTDFDSSFQQKIKWDIPLLEGYPFVFQTAGARAQNQELKKAITEWKPDAILIIGWNPPGHLSIMRYFKGKIPVWFRGDSTLLDEQPGLRKLVRRIFLRWVYKHVDLAFYVGSANKKYFLKHRLKENQLRFAPHAIDNERFANSEERSYEQKALEWREKLGLSAKDYAVLFVGKLERVKNPALLLEAVKKMNRQNKQSIHLLFVGSGELEKILKEKADNTTFVHFLGFQNQRSMPIVYRLANLYCLPSISETWGLAVNEALACGRPVLVSNKVGCASDLVVKPYLGSIFESRNVEDLIDKALRIHQSNDENRIRRQEFIQPWNFKNIALAIEEAFTA